MQTTDTTCGLLEAARQVIRSEEQALQSVACQLNGEFCKAVDLIANCDGHVVVSGLGKSGMIAMKMSATLASTGTPSHFMHPTEAFHGDLGRIRRGDVVTLLSYSGSTDEVASLAAILKQDDVPIISITKSAKTRVGLLSDAALAVGQIDEACQNGLAPTSTTTAMMALGDALAIVVSKQRNFTAEDFGKSHPGGNLGKSMMPVRDFLRFKVGENIVIGYADQTVGDLLAAADVFPRRCGAILIADQPNMPLSGILTDSDLRRLLMSHGGAMLKMKVGDVMTQKPITVQGDAPIREAIQIIREKRLDELAVVDSTGSPKGLLDVQDLIAVKLIED